MMRQITLTVEDCIASQLERIPTEEVSSLLTQAIEIAAAKRKAAGKELIKASIEMSNYAQAQGLTEEILDEILAENS